MAKSFALRNASTGALVATRVKRAADPLSRGIGLLARSHVGPDEGVWLGGCAAVHTLGMRATLDLYFLDSQRRVLKIVRAVGPGRWSVSARGASDVVELGAAHEERAVRTGDRLVLE